MDDGGAEAAKSRMQNSVDENSAGHKMVFPNRTLILFLVFLDLFGVGIAMPLVTPLVKSLGATPVQIGLLSSFYGAVQLISSPFMGLLSDRWGRKWVMLLSNMGTMIGYFILGFSSTLQMVVLARVVTGLLKHSQNATKAYVADHTTRSNRAVELGRMATASALGIMVGPTVGGFLFKAGGYGVAGSAAASLYVLNTLIIVGSLPPDKITTNFALSQESKKWYHHLPKVSMLARPRIAALFIVRLVLGLAIQTFRQGFSLLLLYRFNLGVQGNGYLISYQGALSSLVQAFAIKPLVKKYEDGEILFRGMILLGLSFFGCSWSPTLVILMVVLTPVAFSSGVLRTTFAATITAVVPSTEVGQILGLSEATMSMCRIAGPALAGFLASAGGPGLPGNVSGILMLIAATLLYATGCHKNNYNSSLSKESFEKGDEHVLKLEGKKPLLDPNSFTNFENDKINNDILQSNGRENLIAGLSSESIIQSKSLNNIQISSQNNSQKNPQDDLQINLQNNFQNKINMIGRQLSFNDVVYLEKIKNGKNA